MSGDWAVTDVESVMRRAGYVTQRVSFDSDGSSIAGVFYRPVQSDVEAPCVVMAHGFSGTMDWILPDFAETFAKGGLAVLVFDYRCLGSSDGTPRQLIDSRRQLADLRRAVAFARTSSGIDARRIALWGTSLGGSHVITVAAEDHRIAAVVANVPAIDMFRGMRGRFTPPGFRPSAAEIIVSTAGLLGAAAVDTARGALGLSPHYIAVYGPLGHAVFSDPALAERFRDIEEHPPTWRNRVTPRFLFTAPRYRAGTIGRITCPILVTLARDDAQLSSAFVKEKIAEARSYEIHEYPVGHFDVYHGAVLAQVAEDQLAFLQHCLRDPVSHSPRHRNKRSTS